MPLVLANLLYHPKSLNFASLYSGLIPVVPLAQAQNYGLEPLPRARPVKVHNEILGSKEF